MTARRKARGTASRLEALEETADQRRAAVEAAKDEAWGRVFSRMTREDRRAVDAFCDCEEENGAQWAEVRRLLSLASGPPLPSPFSEAAHTWQEQAADTPEGQPWPVPAHPDGFVTYFEAEATRADSAGTLYALAPALLTGARWSAAWWRMVAMLVREVGRQTLPR